MMTSTAAFADTPASQVPNNPKAATPQAMVKKVLEKQKLADQYMANIKNNSTQKSSLISPNGVVGSPTYYDLGVSTIAENPDWNCGPAATLPDANWYSPTNPYYQSPSDNPYNEPSQYNLRSLEKNHFWRHSSGAELRSSPLPFFISPQEKTLNTSGVKGFKD